MKRSASIQSDDKQQTLEATLLDRDVLLTLANAGIRLELRFSSLMRASFARPWITSHSI